MDRTTTYMVLALVVLLGIGALIFANSATETPTTGATGTGAGTTGTTQQTAPPPATKP
jgi:hypothetical protein